MNGSSAHNPDIDTLIAQVNSGRELQLSGALNIAVNRVEFTLAAGEGIIVLACRNLSDVLSLLKTVFLPLIENADRKKIFETVLARTGSTLCLQSRFLKIYGPRANPLLRVLLNGIIATRR